MTSLRESGAKRSMPPKSCCVFASVILACISLFSANNASAGEEQNSSCLAPAMSITLHWEKVPSDMLDENQLLPKDGVTLTKSEKLPSGGSTFTFLGPEFDGPDHIANVRLDCGSGQALIDFSLVRPNEFHGAILSNAVWRPELILSLRGGLPIRFTTNWDLRFENGVRVEPHDARSRSFPLIVSRNVDVISAP